MFGARPHSGSGGPRANQQQRWPRPPPLACQLSYFLFFSFLRRGLRPGKALTLTGTRMWELVESPSRAWGLGFLVGEKGQRCDRERVDPASSCDRIRMESQCPGLEMPCFSPVAES